MRDGIFKSLNMGPHWRTFMDRCNRPADHGARVREGALEVFSRDIANELSSVFRRALLAYVTQAQQSLPGLGPFLPSWGDAAAASPLEREVRLQFERRAHSGLLPDSHARAALTDALEAWSDQRLRQVEQDVARKDLLAAQMPIAQARTALKSLIAGLVDGVLDGEKPTKRQRMRKPLLDLDDDLRISR